MGIVECNILVYKGDKYCGKEHGKYFLTSDGPV